MPTAAGEGRWIDGPMLKGQVLFPSAVRTQPEGGMLVQFTPSPGLAVKSWQIGMLRGVGIEVPSAIRSVGARATICNNRKWAEKILP